MKIKNFFQKNKELIFWFLGLFRFLPDAWYLRCIYRLKTGRRLHLKRPVTFNEKIQWLKLYDRRSEYTVMVDKHAVKRYAADRIGDSYIIPTLGVWDRAQDIDFSSLPGQFVLKCTHDSGGLVLCRDKASLDLEAARKKLSRRLRVNYYHVFREWAYRDVKPKIIAEPYLRDSCHVVPKDYKVYCFGGKPHYIVVFHNRFDAEKKRYETVYDTDWNLQGCSFDRHFAVGTVPEKRPACLEKLLELSRALSRDIPQARIDFYIIEEKIYFGEITLYTASGLQRMIPEELDGILGELVILPLRTQEKGAKKG